MDVKVQRKFTNSRHIWDLAKWKINIYGIIILVHNSWGDHSPPPLLKAPTLLPIMSPFYSFCFLIPFFIRPTFTTFYTVLPPQRSIVNPRTSSNKLTCPIPSHWRYLFLATSRNHLKWDKTNLKPLLFSALLHHQTD